jgi:hypothetical protein
LSGAFSDGASGDRNPALRKKRSFCLIRSWPNLLRLPKTQTMCSPVGENGVYSIASIDRKHW